MIIIDTILKKRQEENNPIKVAMIGAGIITGKSMPYWTAIGCVAFIFIYQQKIARSRDIGVALRKFFKANIYVSPLLLFGTLIDVLL